MPHVTLTGILKNSHTQMSPLCSCNAESQGTLWWLVLSHRVLGISHASFTRTVDFLRIQTTPSLITDLPWEGEYKCC